MESITEKPGHIIKGSDHIREKAYFAVSIMEQFCHMKMNGELAVLDFDVLHEKTIDAVISVLN